MSYTEHQRKSFGNKHRKGFGSSKPSEHMTKITPKNSILMPKEWLATHTDNDTVPDFWELPEKSPIFKAWEEAFIDECTNYGSMDDYELEFFTKRGYLPYEGMKGTDWGLWSKIVDDEDQTPNHENEWLNKRWRLR